MKTLMIAHGVLAVAGVLCMVAGELGAGLVLALMLCGVSYGVLHVAGRMVDAEDADGDEMTLGEELEMGGSLERRSA